MSEITHKIGIVDGVVWLHPVAIDRISSSFGYRWHPTTGEWTMHNGIDLPKAQGTPIYATRAGVIDLCQTLHATAGNWLKIKHDGGFESIYMHLYKFEDGIRTKVEVKQGQLIGYVGTTGRSTGPHLHFGIRKSGQYVNPKDYLYTNDGSITISDEGRDEVSTLLVQKEPPSHDNWKPLLPDYKYPIKDGSNISFMHQRRGAIIADSQRYLFNNGMVPTSIGLGYNFVGINSSHPAFNSYESISDDELYGVRTSLPESSDSREFWISEHSNESGMLGSNPYLSQGHIHSMDGHANNAYGWGRSHEIISTYSDEELPGEIVCRSSNTDWYEYNKSKGLYNFGHVPSVGAIICWENNQYSPTGLCEELTYVGIVEEVLGSDVIKMSEISYNSDTHAPEFHYTIKTNANNNWGMDKLKYTFRGFIYLLPQVTFYPNIVISKEGGMEINCDSSTTEHCASVSFGIGDIKHYNRMRVEYDIEVATANTKDRKYSESDGTHILQNLNDYCSICVHMSQQVASCGTGEVSELWPRSYFPQLLEDNSGGDAPNHDMGYPFPDGVVLLKKMDDNKLTSSSEQIESKFVYARHGVLDTILLNKCELDGKSVEVFNENSDGLKCFNRELPTYIGFTISSTKTSNGVDEFDTNIKFRIRRIILYR